MTAHAGRLRVGVVGLGKIAQLHHLPNLAAMPEVELAGLCDRSLTLAARLAHEYGLPSSAAVTDHQALLDGGLQALVVANRHHGPIVGDALAAGIPVFVEKPVCWGLDEAAELSALAERTGTPVVVGYMKRYDPAVERLLDLGGRDELSYARAHNFAGGRHRHERLREVLKPGADVAADGRPDENSVIDEIVDAHLPGRGAGARQAVRGLAELAIHDLNLLSAVLGPARVLRCEATPAPGGTCYTAALRYGETMCTLEILADFSTARDWDEQVSFYSGHGLVELGFASPFLHNAPTTLRRRGADGTDVIASDVIVSRVSPFLSELRHFHQVATGAATSRTPLAEAAADLRLVYDLACAMTFAGGS